MNFETKAKAILERWPNIGMECDEEELCKALINALVEAYITGLADALKTPQGELLPSEVVPVHKTEHKTETKLCNTQQGDLTWTPLREPKPEMRPMRSCPECRSMMCSCDPAAAENPPLPQGKEEPKEPKAEPCSVEKLVQAWTQFEPKVPFCYHLACWLARKRR